MITIETKRFLFSKRMIWFSESPFDVTGCDAVFFYACKNDVNVPGFKKRKAPTIIIDLEDDLDTLWKGVGKTTRKHINRAIRGGVTIVINDNYEEFYKMYERFARKKGFKSYPVDINTMKRQGTLFTAVFNDKVVAGVFALEDSKNIRGLIGGSIRFEVNERNAPIVSYAYRLVLWEIIKYAKEKGIKAFDFGGYYGGKNKNDPRSTIDSFKWQFGGRLVTYYNYEKYYSRLYALIKSVKRKIKTRVER